MPGPVVRRVDGDEVESVGALIALAFNELDADAYLVPPLEDRQRVCGGYFTMYTKHALKYGRIDVIGERDGLIAAAVWFDRTRGVPVPNDYERRLVDFAGAYVSRFRALEDLLDAHHPSQPHWQLAFLGVHPGCRNQGLGSALLRHHHDEMDSAGAAEYLEASNQDSARLYRRHGYHDMSPSAIRLPDGTPFFRMWRDAR